MNSSLTFSHSTLQDTVCISVAEFEHLIECKKELRQIREDLTLILGDDL